MADVQFTVKVETQMMKAVGRLSRAEEDLGRGMERLSNSALSSTSSVWSPKEKEGEACLSPHPPGVSYKVARKGVLYLE